MEDKDALVISTLFEIKQNIGSNDAKTDALLRNVDVLREVQTSTLAQATKTNGRVTSLEKWRAYLLGAFAALSTVVIIEAWFITNHHQVVEQISSSQIK